MELGSRNEAVQARRGGVLERADEASVVVVLIVITVAERVVLLDLEKHNATDDSDAIETSYRNLQTCPPEGIGESIPIVRRLSSHPSGDEFVD